jgi:hypothetical protein
VSGDESLVSVGVVVLGVVVAAVVGSPLGSLVLGVVVPGPVGSVASVLETVPSVSPLAFSSSSAGHAVSAAAQHSAPHRVVATQLRACTAAV